MVTIKSRYCYQLAEEKLERDQKLCEDYKAFMEDIVAEGHDCKAPPPIKRVSKRESRGISPTMGFAIPTSRIKSGWFSIAQQSSWDNRSMTCCTRVQTLPTHLLEYLQGYAKTE